MTPGKRESTAAQNITSRARDLMAEHQTRVYTQTSRIFAILIAVEWAAALVADVWISPPIRGHLALAALLSAAIAIAPLFLALTRPAAPSTRYVVAIGQMLLSVLLIQLTGARLETHFLIFISLAVLAFYRDWRLFIPATMVILADHAARGLYLPMAWVIFENVILFKSCLRGTQEMWEIAARQASIEAIGRNLENTLQFRTAERDMARMEAEAATAGPFPDPYKDSLHRLSRAAQLSAAQSRPRHSEPATEVHV